MRPPPSFSAANERLAYDPATGAFTHKARLRLPAGPAGATNDDGYRIICVNYRRCRAHQLAWLLTHGEWPDRDIDHINGDRADNRLANLRLATRTENNANARVHSQSRSGLKGVSYHRTHRKWFARIKKHGRSIFLGYFDSPDAAHAAYVAAAPGVHGAFARAE